MSEEFIDVDWSNVDKQIEETEKSYSKSNNFKDERLFEMNKSKKEAKTPSEVYWMYLLPKFVKVPSVDGKTTRLTAQKPIFELKRHKINFEVDKPDGSGKQKKWINFICPKTFDQEAKCLCCERSKELKNSDILDDKEEGKQLWAKTFYAMNTLVLRNNFDSKQEGKVKVFETSFQIHQKISKFVSPTVEEIDADPTIEPVNIWKVEKTAVPFKLKVEFEPTKPLPSYSNSCFEKKFLGPLRDVSLTRDEHGKCEKFTFSKNKTNEEIIKICSEECFDLYEFFKEKEFLTYEQTKEKMASYFGTSSKGEELVGKASEEEIFKKSEKEDFKKVESKTESKTETETETESNESDDLDDEFNDIINSSDDLDEMLNEM